MNHIVLYLGSLIFIPLIIMGVYAKLISGTNDPLIAYLVGMLVTHFAYDRVKEYSEEIKNKEEKKES